MTGIAEAPRVVAVRERLTGAEALVRVVVEQADTDTRAGLRTGGFVTGYPGSPLGRVADTFEAAAVQLDPMRIVFSLGLNHELTAPAAWGQSDRWLRTGRDCRRRVRQVGQYNNLRGTVQAQL